jgi:hypothetical protein
MIGSWSFPSCRAESLRPLFQRVAVVLVALALFAPAAMAAEAHVASAEPDPLITSLVQQAPGLRAEVMRLALNAARRASEQGYVRKKDLLTVIDYTIPSTQPRLFIFDLARQRLLYRELVAHGKNSGDDMTTRFSNTHGSLATSLGLFVTADPYFGSNGYSLRLKGLDEGFNDQAWERAIVMHGAPYVNSGTAKALGRLGRSWGCPAVRKEVAKEIIDTVKGGSPIFAYFPDDVWLKSSRFLVQ